ncbi:MAG: beta-N-acetylhexosaminidase [Vulcanimicrobiaceae bacterium]
MSFHSLAAQVVCTGFTGTSEADAPLERMANLGIRATILFPRNLEHPEQVQQLTSALQRALGDTAPALIGIDQEGGAVARLREGVVALPSMMALGATRDVDLARRAARRLGCDLRALGINLNFAPVLDLALEPGNTVIGTRSFGGDPHTVSEFGHAFAVGLRSGGVVAVGKHFPGHGATATDSHVARPVVAVDAATLRARDLIPFADAIGAGISALMTAHVLVPSLDPDLPATMSRVILHDLLRDELHFCGALFSDCFEMAALGEADASLAPRALGAGVDCILISHRLDLAEASIEAIVQAVETGMLSSERLSEAAARMRALRASIGPNPSQDEDARVGDAAVGREIARKAVTVVRGSIGLEAREPVTVISFEQDEPASLSSALRKRGHKSEIMRVSLEPRVDELELLEMVIAGMPGRQIVIVMRRAHLHPGQAAAITRLLLAAPDSILISAREPYDASLFERAKNLACIYNDTEVSIEGLADVMTARAANA